MARIEDVRAAALELTSDEREQLAMELFGSVDKEEGYDEAWDAEIKRRIEEIDSGAVETVPGEEVMARLRQKVADAARLPVSS